MKINAEVRQEVKRGEYTMEVLEMIAKAYLLTEEHFTPEDYQDAIVAKITADNKLNQVAPWQGKKTTNEDILARLETIPVIDEAAWNRILATVQAQAPQGVVYTPEQLESIGRQIYEKAKAETTVAPPVINPQSAPPTPPVTPQVNTSSGNDSKGNEKHSEPGFWNGFFKNVNPFGGKKGH